MKKQNNGRNQTVITTTNTKDSTEPKEKQIQLPVSLRDYFAAKAMQAIINETSINVGPNAQADDLWNAKVAYRYADAMLKAREA